MSSSSSSSSGGADRVLRCCVLAAGGQRVVRLRVAPGDSVASLAELAAAKLRRKYAAAAAAAAGDERDAVVGLRSQRLERDLHLDETLEHVIMDGDVLEARPYTIAICTRASTRMRKYTHADASHAVSQVAIATFGTAAKPGVFTVTPIKGEGLPVLGMLRVGRASLGVRLFPYDDVVATPPAMGPDFMWGAPIHFKHTDASRNQLLLHVHVHEDPLFSAKSVVGSALCSLQATVEAPGTSITKWLAVKRAETPALGGDDGGRLLVSICFHPKVSKGPTLQTLLRALAQEEQSRAASPTESAKATRRTLFSKRATKLQTKLQAVISQQANQRAIGRLRFALSGLHLCSAQCSKVGGHSLSSSREFAPVVRITFGEFEEEIRGSDCDLVRFEREWSVYSCFARVEVEVLRKVAIPAGPVQRLRDGSPAVRVCSATISCHDIQERDAASWTFDPPEPCLGPGRSLPRAGFVWHSLSAGDDDVGLAQIRAEYKEDLFALLDANESSDVSYVAPDERSFDPMIILRNFERLDDIYLLVKAFTNSVAEILDWKRPACTLVVWMALNACLLYLPASLVPSFLALLFVGVLLVNYGYFLLGHTHNKWIRRVNGNSGRAAFRPVGTLRIVPVSAANLRSAADSGSPDTYVRIFYEPNYKALPVLLVAQTECARNTRSPVWAVSQSGAKTRDAEFLRANTRWVKSSMFRHMSSHEQEAVAHDVVEPWTRADGQVDTHAFKYPILQPVHKEQPSGEEELTPWRDCPGAIRFDVMQENVAAQPVLVGRTRIPIKCLVGDEAGGGPQVELKQAFPLILPARLTKTKAGGELERAQVTSRPPSLTVRMQLFLRDPRSRVTLKEALASEALYNAIEMESQKELTLVEKYHKAKDVAKNIQQTLGSVCSSIERSKNLLLWVHPRKTLLVLVVAVAGCLGLYFVPLRYMLVYSAAKMFTKKFHKLEDRDAVRLRNLIATIPSDLDMRRIYNAKNQEFLRMKEHTETQAKLQAEWAGHLWKQGEGMFNEWQERYCAIRSGRLEYWQSITDAKSGIPPKGAIIFSNVIERCSKVESLTLPKDAYPMVIFDVSRRVLVYSPRGRRRLICAKSEEDFHMLEQTIYRTGERISVSGSAAAPLPR